MSSLCGINKLEWVVPVQSGLDLLFARGAPKEIHRLSKGSTRWFLMAKHPFD